MVRYSVSQVQTYIQCPLKYRHLYIDKIPTPDFIETTDTLLGKLVHESLQNLYNKINIFKTPSKEEIITDYYKLREKKEKETTENGGEIVNNHTDLSIDDFKRRGELYLSRYYDKHSPFKELQVISTEKQISFQLDKGINFLGIIDRLDKIGDTFIINDYKTNKTLPTNEKDQYIEQLTLYGLGIQQKYSRYFKNLKAKLYFLHFDIEDERELTQEKLEEIKNKYLKIIREIEQNKVQYAMGSKKIFESNQSPLCAWCNFQSICPIFSAINSDNGNEGKLSDKNITALVDDFIEINNKISELEKQKDLLKGIFQKYIIKKDPNDEKSDYILSGTKSNIKVTKSQKIDVIDKEKFIQKIKDLGLLEKYANIPQESLNNLFFKSGKIKLSDFTGTVEQDFTLSIEEQSKK